MRGSQIIVSAEPKGRFEGVIVSGTPKPGTVMLQTSAAVSAGVGRATYAARSGVLDGAPGPVAVLLEDYLQGGNATQAYVSGSWGMLYWPVAGEELIGTELEIQGSTGKLQAKGTFNTPSGAHVSAPFMMMEQLVTPFTADSLTWCKYLGNAA